MKEIVNIFWFRRDLRLHDNAGLYYALKSGRRVVPVFIFDRDILDQLEDQNDRRVEFILSALAEIQEELIRLGSTLHVYYDKAEAAWKKILSDYSIEKVFTNGDYEVYARDRDERIAGLLAGNGIKFCAYKDQVIFEKDEVVKEDGKPYTVFTPYSKKWRALADDYYLKSFPVENYHSNFCKQNPRPLPTPAEIGFVNNRIPFPSKKLNEELISHYSEQRDFPGLAGTSKMGVHLRFGTVSIRQLARRAFHLNDTFVNELIWRDFYQMILWQFPKIGKGYSFKEAYDLIEWRNNEREFDSWCKGETGYPLVDAGMRELNETGFMHNRVRMVVASFLAKHLLIDWRWGESYFARRLLDFDFAANNGGWQWAAGSGCDAAPYFRIFNPTLQAKKFDPQLKYIRKWVPELDELYYPQPIVDHEFARKRCLEVYSKAINEKKQPG